MNKDHASMHRKTVIVTGASGDIGRATAKEFHNSGFNVVVMDISEKIYEFSRDTGCDEDRILPLRCDVSSEQDFDAAVESVMARYASIDVLVNNAGVEGERNTIDKLGYAEFMRVMHVNLGSTFLGISRVVPHMLKQASGCIVNLASTASFRAGAEGMSAYVASKHAILGLTRTAALEWGRHGIRVNCVCPGPIDGRMIRSIHMDRDSGTSAEGRKAREQVVPMRRFGEAREVAAVIAFLASDAASYVNGAAYPVDGGICAI